MIFYLFIALILTVTLSFRISAGLAKNLNFGIYRAILAPGIIIHELSHAVGCFITGARIVDLNLLDKNGGEVKHEQPAVPVLGMLIISTAPLVSGLLIVFLLLNRVGVNINPDDINFNFREVMPLLNHMVQLLINIDWAKPINYLYIYLLISLTVTISPSKTDLIYALPGLVLILLLGIFIPQFSDLIPESLVIRLWLLVLIQFAIFLGLLVIDVAGGLTKKTGK